MDDKQAADLISRITAVETKVDQLIRYMERATGAWLFLKICGGIALGAAMLWGAAAGIIDRFFLH